MKKNLINGNFSLDSRDARIFEAMISNLNHFLKDADRKVVNHPSGSIGVKKTYIVLTTVTEDDEKIGTVEAARNLNNAIKELSPDHAMEFPEPHMDLHHCGGH